MSTRGFGSWGEGIFIFRELGSTGNFFRELASELMVLGFREPCKK